MPPTQTQEFFTITVEFNGPVAWLLYNHGPRNAWTWKMLEEQAQVLRQLSEDEAVRVIVLASAIPKYFSVGADLAQFDKISEADMARWVDACHKCAMLIREAPMH